MLHGNGLAVGALFLAALPGFLAAQLPDDAAPAELAGASHAPSAVGWLKKVL